MTTTPLQLLVMNKAKDAPTLASASNHSAFNLANAGGAWLGGVAIAAGWGWTSPAFVGAVLAAAGLAIALTAGFLDLSKPVRRLRTEPLSGTDPQEHRPEAHPATSGPSGGAFSSPSGA